MTLILHARWVGKAVRFSQLKVQSDAMFLMQINAIPRSGHIQKAIAADFNHAMRQEPKWQEMRRSGW
jgi:hypothetical protein